MSLIPAAISMPGCPMEYSHIHLQTVLALSPTCVITLDKLPSQNLGSLVYKVEIVNKQWFM